MSGKREDGWLSAETVTAEEGAEGASDGTVRTRLPEAGSEASVPGQDTHVGAEPSPEAEAWGEEPPWGNDPRQADYGDVQPASHEPWDAAEADELTEHEVSPEQVARTQRPPREPPASVSVEEDGVYELPGHLSYADLAEEASRDVGGTYELEVGDDDLIEAQEIASRSRERADRADPTEMTVDDQGDGEDLEDDEDIFEVRSQDIELAGGLEDFMPLRDAPPHVGTTAPPRGDATDPLAASPLAHELAAQADATPFAVATDEILLEDLVESSPLSDAAPAEATSADYAIDDETGFDDEPYWQERAEALLEQQKLVRNTRREHELLRELGRIYDQCLIDREEAIAAYERLLSLLPGDDESFVALDRLYQHAWETDKLAELLLDRQEHVEGADDKAELLARVAELYAQAGERDKAEVVLDAALSLAPAHARVQQVTALLAQAEAAAPIAAVPSAPSQVPPAPPPPKDPIEELEERLAEAAGDDQRADILDRLATLYLRQDAPQRAAECLHQLLTLDRRRDSAYRRLAAIYRQHERFDDLGRVLELHARVAAAEPRVELLRQLAELYEGPLHDPAIAVASYERLRELSPDDPQALRSLLGYHEQHYQQSGDATSLLALLRDAALRARGPERVELTFRQAKLLAEAVGDPYGAEELYQRALEIDPAHGPSIGELTEIYRGRGDWGKAVRMMCAAEAASSSPAQKARYLYEAGLTSLEQLDDRRGATELLSRCLAVDPDHQQAAEALAELYYADQAFEHLGPVLEVLLRKTARDDTPRQVELNHKLGAVAAAVGDRERAVRAYRKAVQLDGSHMQALLGLGELLFEDEDHRQAYDCYLRLGARVEELDAQTQRTVLLRQGTSALALGEKGQARSCFERALLAAPGDEEVLARLSSLQVEGSDWHGALETKQALLAKAEPPQAKALLLEIGDIYRDQLRDARQAELAYRRALELVQAKDRVLLHRLLDLYSDTKQWDRTVEVCEHLAANEQEPSVRAKYFGVAASLCDKHLDRPEEALKYYNRALDVAPDELKAFSAIDAICTRMKDWKKLEQNYGKMLKRMPADGKVELKVMLWHNLGEVMRSRRRDYEGAIAAFEVAQKLDPDNRQRRRILAELYLSSGPNYLERAIAIYQKLLEEKPRDIELYRILGKLYLDGGLYDRAWGLSAVLSFLGQADAEAKDFYRRYRRRSIPIARARLTDDSWPRLLYHPDQDPYLSGVFAILATPIAAMTARPHSHYELKRKDAYDFHGQKEHPFCRLFVYIQGVLHAPAFDLFLDPSRQASLQLAHTSEATSLVAGGHILSEERPEKELAFMVGKQLAFLRPDLFLRLALPSRAQLQGALLSACLMVNPKTPLPVGEEKAINRSVSQLRKQLAYPQIEQLGNLLSRVERPERVDLTVWRNAVELTTDRVGLLLCNDLDIAAKVIAAEPSAAGIPSRERAEQLVRFACSDAYFKLRKELAITIEDAA
jgi:tetratricopeptide (TPR) repeat protein